MQVLSTTTGEEVILTWLRSEWHALPGGTPSDRRLIDNPDLTDAGQNDARERLLLDGHRGVILGTLPPAAPAQWVLIDEADLPKLFVIPSGDWYLDTGGTFRLIDAANHLRPGRGSAFPEQLGPINHYDAVNAKSEYVRNYDAITTDEMLILIASSEAGPFTIIDGNHRAAALYRSHLSEPNMPRKGILICDPRIAHSKWYINSQEARLNIRQISLLASRGLLW
jgi:hypothetical protein